MFIFYFLGVGPPCRSILCQFWLCEERSVSTYAAILVLSQLFQYIVIMSFYCVLDFTVSDESWLPFVLFLHM